MQVLLGIFHRVFVDFVLVVLFVHPDIVRVSEVGVGHFLAFEDDVFELVVGTVNRFSHGTVEKILHLHLDGGGAAATLGVFGLQDNHRILTDHEHVAGTQLLRGLHNVCIP